MNPPHSSRQWLECDKKRLKRSFCLTEGVNVDPLFVYVYARDKR